METPLDQAFLIIMLFNIGVVFSLLVIDVILGLGFYLIKLKEKRVKRLTGRYRPRIVEGGILRQGGIDDRVASKITKSLISLFKEARYLGRALNGKRGDEIGEICRELSIYRYYLPGLKSRRRWKRARACYLLGLLRDPRAAESLVLLLSDPSPEVRAAAAQAIGSIGDESSLMPLTLLLDDKDKWVVMASLEALSLLGGGYAGMLVHFLNHPTPEVRSRIALILGQVGSPVIATDLIGALCREEEASVKVELIRSLGELKDRGATETIIGLLSSDEVAVVIEAVRSLGKTADDRAMIPLIKLLADERWDLKHEAIEALKGFERGDLINALIEIITEADEMLISGILELIDDLKDEKLVGALIKLLDYPNPEVVSKAIEALGEQRDTRATLPLINILRSSPHWFLRARAAKALGKIGDGRALGSLQEASADTNRWVSLRSTEALKSLRLQSS
jgi:HEAT repeat protein